MTGSGSRKYSLSLRLGGVEPSGKVSNVGHAHPAYLLRVRVGLVLLKVSNSVEDGVGSVLIVTQVVRIQAAMVPVHGVYVVNLGYKTFPFSSK